MSESKSVFIKRGSIAIGVEVKEFKKAEFLDVRNYYDAGGEWKPTAKGIMIPIEHGNEVLRAMEELLDQYGPKQSVPKAAKVTLYFISRTEPKFPYGVMRIYSNRVFERSSRARKAAVDRHMRTGSGPYKVFKYSGPEPTIVDYEGAEYCAFEQKAGKMKIRQVE